VTALLCTSKVLAAGTEKENPETKTTKPIVKVLTPAGAGFVMGSWGTSKILIVLEITDTSGTGVATDDFGTPRFVEPNKNVDLFVDHIVEKGSYVNGTGLTVMQVVSIVPTENLKTGTYRLTPPVDLASVPDRVRKEGFSYPSDAMLDAVDFNFQVKDRNGSTSDVSRLAVAFAQDLFKGPFSPPPNEKQAQPKNNHEEGTKPTKP